MKKTPWVLLVLLLFAFGLRLYGVSRLSLRGDEAATVFAVRRPWGEMLALFQGPTPFQPLYHILLRGLVRVAGDGELAARFLPITCGVLLLPLLYALARRLWGRRGHSIGLWAVGLAAINPMLIWDAQDNRMYPLLGLLSLATIYWASRVAQAPARRAWVAFVLCATAALYTHYLAAFTLLTANALFATLLWRQPRRGAALARWLSAQLAAVALFAPRLWDSLTAAATFTSDFLPALSAREMARRTLTGLTLGISLDARMAGALSPGFLTVGALGAHALWTEGRAAGRRLLAWLLTYALLPVAAIAAFSRWRFPIYDERYALLALPPVLLLLACGLAQVAARGWRRWLAVAGLIWIVAASAYALHSYYFDPAYRKGVDWRAYVARLLACARPGDLLIQNYPDPGLTYHLRERLPRVLLPESYPVDEAATVAALQRLLETHPRLWLQPQRYARWDAEGLVAAWLERHALRVAEERFRNVRLALYLPPGAHPEAYRPLEATLGDGIALLGYRLERRDEWERRRADDPLPAEPLATCAPGEDLTLTLLWRADAAIPASYTVFAHLYDAQMRLVTQHDGLPAEGAYPTGRWRVGEVIVDRHTLHVPADAARGECRLGVGMYLLESGVRLPARQGDALPPERTVWLQAVEIE